MDDLYDPRVGEWLSNNTKPKMISAMPRIQTKSIIQMQLYQCDIIRAFVCVDVGIRLWLGKRAKRIDLNFKTSWRSPSGKFVEYQVDGCMFEATEDLILLAKLKFDKSDYTVIEQIPDWGPVPEWWRPGDG